MFSSYVKACDRQTDRQMHNLLCPSPIGAGHNNYYSGSVQETQLSNIRVVVYKQNPVQKSHYGCTFTQPQNNITVTHSENMVLLHRLSLSTVIYHSGPMLLLLLIHMPGKSSHWSFERLCLLTASRNI